MHALLPSSARAQFDYWTTRETTTQAHGRVNKIPILPNRHQMCVAVLKLDARLVAIHDDFDQTCNGLYSKCNRREMTKPLAHVTRNWKLN